MCDACPTQLGQWSSHVGQEIQRLARSDGIDQVCVTSAFPGLLQPLLPVLVKWDIGTLFSGCGSREQTMVQFHPTAFHLLVAGVLLHLVYLRQTVNSTAVSDVAGVDDILERLVYFHLGFLDRLGAAVEMDLNGRTWRWSCRSDSFSSRVPHLDALFLFVAFARGFRPLPSTER